MIAYIVKAFNPNGAMSIRTVFSASEADAVIADFERRGWEVDEFFTEDR